MSQAAHVTSTLPTLLSTVDRPGDYVGTGTVELPVVRIVVDGVGLLGLPLPRAQAEALGSVASPAPYGRGAETLHDPDVRRCGQIPATAVRLEDPRWARTLDVVRGAAAAALGVDGPVEAQLYKLLVYEPGGFFAEHRDTEKADGMFATLVVVLPSEHEGGELVVRHDGRERVLNLASGDLGCLSWAAFYTDCQHELRPVRAGYRVALVYNLIRRGAALPDVPDARPVIAEAAAALRGWPEEAPPKLVYPLKHQYSLAALAFGTLKNEDAAAAAVLAAACVEAQGVLHLAMVSIEESGSAERVYQGRDAWGTEETYEPIEVFDRLETLVSWRRPDDTPAPLGPIPFDDEEVGPPGALDDEEPDEERFLEATGNEGCSFERTYRRAALVVWPVSRELEVLHQAGPEAGVAVLERLLDEDPARAASLAESLVSDWATGAGAGRGRGVLRARLLAALGRLPDGDTLRRFLLTVVAPGELDGEDTEALVTALGVVDGGTAREVLHQLTTTRVVTTFAPVAGLLRVAVEVLPIHTVRPAVGAAVVALPGIGEGTSPWLHRGSSLEVRGAGLADLLHAVARCDEAELATALLESIHENPLVWPMDEVVVPTALARDPAGDPPWSAVVRGFRELARRHLTRRLALPLVAPTDAVRSPIGLTCECEDCASLRAFLAHPIERAWSLKAAKVQRRHVESEIGKARSDVDLRTDMRGNPHTLICTKNQASYEARVRQREQDVARSARLER